MLLHINKTIIEGVVSLNSHQIKTTHIIVFKKAQFFNAFIRLFDCSGPLRNLSCAFSSLYAATLWNYKYLIRW